MMSACSIHVMSGVAWWLSSSSKSFRMVSEMRWLRVVDGVVVVMASELVLRWRCLVVAHCNHSAVGSQCGTVGGFAMLPCKVAG